MVEIDPRKYDDKVVGIFASCGDLLHAGHLLALKEAREELMRRCLPGQTPWLIFLLQSDPTIDRKEKNKPVETLEERETRVDACKYVDERINYATEGSLYEQLWHLRPVADLRFLGEEYKGKQFTGSDLAIPIFYNKRLHHGYSTTALRKRTWEAEEAKRACEIPRGPIAVPAPTWWERARAFVHNLFPSEPVAS